MQDKNETAALIRRLGGAANVARLLNISRQAVHKWIDADKISENYVSNMLDLCLADGLPVSQPQIWAKWEARETAHEIEK